MTKKIPGTEEAWEDRQLGADEKYAAVYEGDTSALDESLDLQPISIRLQKSLIENFKLIASINGEIKYQTLMRQALTRFADCEMKRILRGVADDIARENAEHISQEENQHKKAA